MAESQVALDFVTLCLMFFFGAAGAYAVIGNFILFLIMKSKGSEIPFAFGGLAVVAYIREGPDVRSKSLDRFALSVALSVPVVIASALLLYPRIWS